MGQSSHNMYSNNTLNFLESTTILNACTKTLLNVPRINKKFGLPMGKPMGSTHSKDFACILLDFLKSGPFRFITPKDSYYFCYIDHILLIYSRNNDSRKITDRLNNIEPSIDFSDEVENNSPFPFLVIFQINNE